MRDASAVRHRGPTWAQVAVIAAALMVAMPLAASAAGEAGEGRLTACYSSVTGHVRLVDPSAGGACAPTEAQTEWYGAQALSAPGTINSLTNPVDWTKLKNVPSGFADGVDDGGGTASGVECAGCVDVSDLAAGARAAAGSAIVTGWTTSTRPDTLDWFSVQAPGPGVLSVTVSGKMYIEPSSSGPSLVAAHIGLCTEPYTWTACGTSPQPVWRHDPDDPSGETPRVPYTIARSIPVAAAGKVIIYVTGQAPPDGRRTAIGLDAGASYDTASVVFAPSALTVARRQ